MAGHFHAWGSRAQAKSSRAKALTTAMLIAMSGNSNWNELPNFGIAIFPNGRDDARFIIRQSQIHRAHAYMVVGGQDDNPDLGQYGRVWVRQGTAQVAASNLPSC